MARMVQTVTGPISTYDMGVTLCHEHLIYGFPGYAGDITCAPFDKKKFIEEFRAFLKSIEEFGLRTVVDATPNDQARDPAFLREISELTGLNIICATGYYYEGCGCTNYFKMRGASAVQDITEMFDKELHVGIGGTGIRAGVIKLASGLGAISPYEQLFFEAAANVAARDPDVRIITHTEGGTCALEQAKFLIGRGVQPRQIAIGHIDGCTDMETLLSVAETGVYLNFDRVGMNGAFNTPLDSRRRACICGLVASGFEDKICLSHDRVFMDLGRNPHPIESFLPGCQWDYIFRTFLPKLREASVSSEQAQKMITLNPQRFYSGE